VSKSEDDLRDMVVSKRCAAAFLDTELIGQALRLLRYTALEHLGILVAKIRDPDATEKDRMAALRELRAMVKDAVVLEAQRSAGRVEDRKALPVDVHEVVGGLHASLTGALGLPQNIEVTGVASQTNRTEIQRGDGTVAADAASQRSASAPGGDGVAGELAAGPGAGSDSGGGPEATFVAAASAAADDGDSDGEEPATDFLEEASRRESQRGNVRKPPRADGRPERIGIVTGRVEDFGDGGESRFI
jgi:hypothetical protein